MNEAISQIEQTLRSCCDLEFSGEVQLLDWAKSTCKDGPKLKLLLPDDESIAPFELATVRKGKQAGQLYHLFAVRLDPDKQSVDSLNVENKPSSEKKDSSLSRWAAMRCNDPLFQKFISQKFWESEKCGPNECRETILLTCGVESRAELDDNEHAAHLFHKHFREPFSEWLYSVEGE